MSTTERSAHPPNHAWRNLWVPPLLLLVAWALRALDVISADAAPPATSMLVAIFLLLVIIGLVLHLVRRRRPDGGS